MCFSILPTELVLTYSNIAIVFSVLFFVYTKKSFFVMQTTALFFLLFKIGGWPVCANNFTADINKFRARTYSVQNVAYNID